MSTFETALQLFKEVKFLVNKTKTTGELVKFLNENPLTYKINFIIENEILSFTYNNKGVEIGVVVVGNEVQDYFNITNSNYTINTSFYDIVKAIA